MTEKFVDIELSASVNNNTLIAELVFSNKTGKKLFLDKLTICHNNKVKNNLFKVLDKNNNRVDYTGMMLKRFITPDDFLAIEPGEEIKSSIALDEVYKVIKGNKYTIQYYAYNPSYEDVSGLEKLESNKVEISY